MKLVFHVLNSPLKGLTYDTDKDVIHVGRSSENDLVLKQHSISRHHAVITQHEGVVTLEDRGSKNASEIDGVVCGGVKELTHGAILTFGDVMVQVQMPELEASESRDDEDEVTPSGAMMAVLDEPGPPGREELSGPDEDRDAMPAGGGVVARPEPVRLEEVERRVWSVLAGILGVAAAVTASIFFINYAGVSDRPLAEIGTSMRVGEVKIVEVPPGFVYHPAVAPPDLARVARTLNLQIAVTVEALSHGMATATLYNPRDEMINLHINILPRMIAGRIDYRPPTLQERELRARDRMLYAESLRLHGRHYEAKKAYEEVVDMLYASVAGAAPLRGRAEERREMLARMIEERHEELRFEMAALMRIGQKREALQRLEDILELIPDENDIRHQNARMLYRMLASMIERRTR